MKRPHSAAPAGVTNGSATPSPKVKLPREQHEAAVEALADLILACVLRYAGDDEAEPQDRKRKE